MGKKNQSKYNKLKGQKVGFNIIEDIIGNKAIVIYECGNRRTLDLWYAATSGKKCSECGNKQSGEENGFFKGYKGLYGNWISKLNKRNKILGFATCDFTMEYLWNLYIFQNKKCALSGLDIEMKIKDNTAYDGYRRTASLDRINSNQGYHKGNIQWVHKDVNIMKNKYDLQYYIHICKLITQSDLSKVIELEDNTNLSGELACSANGYEIK